ncbi:protein REVEILLE 6-like isoform X1 [Papaver somniferum]|uniref:protein REVEILLE 6-like isoform X1 n=1 Tax=Papaver somniferum TaxID=3469 RepID=UPI000E6FD1F8|nr:protein REVEILLE 6-like isoform X1 [Papaver somniferum]
MVPINQSLNFDDQNHHQPQFEMSGLPAELGGGGGGGSISTATAAESYEDSLRKIRKPYTITKSRESWTEQEHDKFFEALQLFDRDWKKIEAFVGTKTVIQIRSHAQKYFQKVQKNGTSEHLPPPRPKRKAVHPYPQKAAKNVPMLPQTTGVCQTSSNLLESRSVVRPDPSSLLKTGPAVSSWPQLSNDDTESARPIASNNCYSSSNNTPSSYPTRETTGQANHGPPLRAIPDFAQVYSFIGSVFDPNTSNHLEKLKEMNPIDVDTVLLLMRNLSMNLSSPDFEDQRRLLSSYDVDSCKAPQENEVPFMNPDESKNPRGR